MNRRDFLRALAAIPLLRVLVRSSRVGWLVADDEVSAAYTAYRQFYSDAVAGPEAPRYLDAITEEPEPDASVGVCLFVDPASGSDDNSGLAPPLSFATIQRALEVLEEEGAGVDGSLIIMC